MPGKTGDSDLEAEEFGMVRGFMTAAHHRKASERWMMVLQGFIHHTTALGRDHSAAVNWKLELLLFF